MLTFLLSCLVLLGTVDVTSSQTVSNTRTTTAGSPAIVELGSTTADERSISSSEEGSSEESGEGSGEAKTRGLPDANFLVSASNETSVSDYAYDEQPLSVPTFASNTTNASATNSSTAGSATPPAAAEASGESGEDYGMDGWASEESTVAPTVANPVTKAPTTAQSGTVAPSTTNRPRPDQVAPSTSAPSRGFLPPVLPGQPVTPTFPFQPPFVPIQPLAQPTPAPWRPTVPMRTAQTGCQSNERVCPCATGTYCLFRAAACLNPTLACPSEVLGTPEVGSSGDFQPSWITPANPSAVSVVGTPAASAPAPYLRPAVTTTTVPPNFQLQLLSGAPVPSSTASLYPALPPVTAPQVNAGSTVSFGTPSTAPLAAAPFSRLPPVVPFLNQPQAIRPAAPPAFPNLPANNFAFPGFGVFPQGPIAAPAPIFGQPPINWPFFNNAGFLAQPQAPLPQTAGSAVAQPATLQASAALPQGPLAAQPAIAQASLQTRPATVQPALAQPALAQPALAQPALAQPALAQPALAQPALAQPALAQPALAQPALAQPALAQPAFAQPALAQPALAQPALAQPALAQSFAQSAVAQPAFQPALVAQPRPVQPVLSLPPQVLRPATTTPLVAPQLPITLAPTSRPVFASARPASG